MDKTMENREILFAQVGVDSAAPGFYTYQVPEDLDIQVGQMVLVPFGYRELVGYVMSVGTSRGNAPGAIKAIKTLIREEPLFGEDFTKLVKFISSYYFYPEGLCVREILPGGLAPKLLKKIQLTPLGLAKDLTGALSTLLRENPNGVNAMDIKDALLKREMSS
ncbi:MAG: hypothetical protein LBF22_10915, partial [Deltaproteobacteria bacterium]|nr:hypothetical protein [Deltaproteobacteria bacterium]